MKYILLGAAIALCIWVIIHSLGYVNFIHKKFINFDKKIE